ncbi:unnamed protein product [Miscanthus lutarioriparius]|uniref:Small nuclear ribonucleoprotein Sm D3 n=1 Tax=Miscanthus lutarioriparius TaxID=422564 RepID=A0A811PYW9_9POAL|nr:unnamed protein product [Miscanthus lutarioriparius]
MSRSLGIPVKLLHEAAGHVVTVELKTGEVYRGSMVECEDNWNCQLENITFTAKDGKVSQLEHVFIRGSRVRFMIVPDMLKNAPMFKRLEARIRGKGSAVGVGRGRAVAMRARAAAGRGGGPVGRGGAPPVRRSGIISFACEDLWGYPDQAQLQMCLSLPIPVSSAKALLFGLGTFASQAHCKTNFRLPHLSPHAGIL